MLGGLFKHLYFFPFIAIHEQLPWLEGWQTVNGKRDNLSSSDVTLSSRIQLKSAKTQTLINYNLQRLN